MRLREPVVGERGHLVEQLPGGRLVDPPLGHPGEQPGAQRLHPLPGALGAHRLAEPVGLGGGEPGEVDRHLHQLLLEQRHAERLAERALEQRVRVGHRLGSVATADVGVDRAALDRPGADQGDLDHQVGERTRPQPGQRRHLGPGLDLEHPDGVGRADHLVHRRVVCRTQAGEVELVAVVLGDQVDGVVQGREHPQPEQIELDEVDRRAVVLVPLQHRAALHARPLHRADLDHRAVADDHPPGVDPEVAGEVLDLGGEPEHRGGDVVIEGPVGAPLGGGGGDLAPHVDLLRPGVLLAGGVAEGTGHVAHRRAGAVGDHVGHQRGVVPPVAGIDVLDHLLAPVGLDVDVDVRRAVTLGGQEPLEEQPQGDRVGLGDPESEAHRRVRRAPPALAVDVLPLAELDDLPHDEEVAGEAELLDHRQLVVDHLPRPGVLGTGAIAAGRPGLDEAAEVGHLVEPVGAGERRQLGSDEGQIEGVAAAERGGGFDHPGEAGEPAGLLVATAQVGEARRRQPAVELVEAAPGADRGQGGRQRAGRGGRVVHVVRRHDRQALRRGELGERVVAVRVERVAVVPQLYDDPVPAERTDQPLQLAAGRGGAVGGESGGDRSLAAAGEHAPVAGTDVGEVAEGEARRALVPGEVAEAERSRQAGVPLRPVGEDDEVLAGWIGQWHGRCPPGAHLAGGVALRQRQPQVVIDGCCSPVGEQGDLGTEDGRQSPGASGLGEADHAVEPVVIGEGERLQSEAVGLLDELLGVGGAVEEGEVRVAVQLGVGHRGSDQRERGPRLVRLALAAQRRAVATRVRTLAPRSPPRRTATRQPPLELGPRHRRIVESHPCQVTNIRSLFQLRSDHPGAPPSRQPPHGATQHAPHLEAIFPLPYTSSAYCCSHVVCSLPPRWPRRRGTTVEPRAGTAPDRSGDRRAPRAGREQPLLPRRRASQCPFLGDGDRRLVGGRGR